MCSYHRFWHCSHLLTMSSWVLQIWFHACGLAWYILITDCQPVLPHGCGKPGQGVSVCSVLTQKCSQCAYLCDLTLFGVWENWCCVETNTVVCRPHDSVVGRHWNTNRQKAYIWTHSKDWMASHWSDKQKHLQPHVTGDHWPHGLVIINMVLNVHRNHKAH